MKLYSVWSEKWDYDEYDEVVVAAKDEEAAWVKVEHLFKEYQLPYIHIDEVDLTFEHIVLKSFIAR